MDRLGYLVPEFPSQTHVFFWREVVALREMGVGVELVSTTRPPGDACRHAFAEGARGETTYLYPPAAADVVEWGRRLMRMPGVGRYVAGLGRPGGRGKAKLAVMSVCAARLVRWARERGVGHVHAHSAADSAHVCAMAYRMGGPTYSLTLHGGLENYGGDYAAKFAEAVAVVTDGRHLVERIVAEVGTGREKLLGSCMGLDTSVFTPRAEEDDGPAGSAPSGTKVRRGAWGAAPVGGDAPSGSGRGARAVGPRGGETQSGGEAPPFRPAPTGLDGGARTHPSSEHAAGGGDVSKTSRDGVLRVVTVARLVKDKGQRHAIEAVRRLRGRGVAVEYVAAGKGEYQGELERQARREGLLGTVKFPGTLGEREVLELLRGSDVFVLASEGTFEAFPISVMEAMSCGRAVVASRIGATPDMIEDGVSGLLIDQGDVDALTDRLGRLAADAGLRRRLGEAARRKAEAEFDVRVTARRLVEFVGGRLAETARSGCGTGVSPVHGPKGRPSERLLQGPEA